MILPTTARSRATPDDGYSRASMGTNSCIERFEVRDE